MERWRDGEMERWRDGEMERWRDGEMERLDGMPRDRCRWWSSKQTKPQLTAIKDRLHGKA
jgi:hypothetical protein